MIGKILSQLLGNSGEDFETAEDNYDKFMEFEEGGWVIVNLQGKKQNLQDVLSHIIYKFEMTCFWLKCDKCVNVLFDLG